MRHHAVIKISHNPNQYPVSPYFEDSQPPKYAKARRRPKGMAFSLSKACNAALAYLDGSLRASRQAANCVVALTCISKYSS